MSTEACNNEGVKQVNLKFAFFLPTLHDNTVYIFLLLQKFLFPFLIKSFGCFPPMVWSIHDFCFVILRSWRILWRVAVEPWGGNKRKGEDYISCLFMRWKRLKVTNGATREGKKLEEEAKACMSPTSDKRRQWWVWGNDYTPKVKLIETRRQSHHQTGVRLIFLMAGDNPRTYAGNIVRRLPVTTNAWWLPPLTTAATATTRSS